MKISLLLLTDGKEKEKKSLGPQDNFLTGRLQTLFCLSDFMNLFLRLAIAMDIPPNVIFMPGDSVNLIFWFGLGVGFCFWLWIGSWIWRSIIVDFI